MSRRGRSSPPNLSPHRGALHQHRSCVSVFSGGWKREWWPSVVCPRAAHKAPLLGTSSTNSSEGNVRRPPVYQAKGRATYPLSCPACTAVMSVVLVCGRRRARVTLTFPLICPAWPAVMSVASSPRVVSQRRQVTVGPDSLVQVRSTCFRGWQVPRRCSVRSSRSMRRWRRGRRRVLGSLWVRFAEGAYLNDC